MFVRSLNILAASLAILAPAHAATLTPIPHVETRGTGKTHLVLIPSIPFDWTFWEPFMERNKGAYTMHAVTLPGLGGTEPPPLKDNDPEIPWLDNAVEAVAKVIEEKNIPDAVVVGHSMGGHLALRLGFEWPDKVARVVSVDGLAAFTVGQAMSPMQRAAMVNSMVAPKFRAMTDEQWSQQVRALVATFSKDPERVNWLQQIAARSTRFGAVEHYIELVKSDVTPWMFKLRRPTLAIATVPGPAETGAAASADKIRQTWREQMSAAENVKVCFFEGTQRLAIYESAADFDRVLADFLADKPVPEAIAPPGPRAPGAQPAPAPGAQPK